MSHPFYRHTLIPLSFVALLMLVACFRPPAPQPDTQAKRQNFIFTETQSLSTTSTTVSSGGITITFDKTADWDAGSGVRGFTANVTILNQSGNVLEDWDLRFHFLATITTMWNATFEHAASSDRYFVFPEGWNATLNNNQSRSFGFQGSYSGVFQAPSSYILSGLPIGAQTPSAPITPACTLETDFVVTADWQNGDGSRGFVAELYLTNTGEYPFNWQLAFDLDATITTMWHASYRRDNSRYSVTPASWNTRIEPNETLSFGFLGSTTDTLTEPQDVSCGHDGNGDDTTPTEPLPAPWQQVTLGSGTATASYDAATATFTSNLNATAESTHFIYQSTPQDASIAARVQLAASSSATAKAGLMLRQSHEAGSPYVFAYIQNGNLWVDYWDAAINQVVTVQGGPLFTPSEARYLRLERKEGRVYVYESDDGVSFTLITTILLSLANPYQLGLATSVTNASTQATFDNVLITEAEAIEETITVTETVGPEGGTIVVNFQEGEQVVNFPAGALLYPVPITVTVTNIPDTTYPEIPELQRSYPPELLRYISPNVTVELPRDALDWDADNLIKPLLGARLALNTSVTDQDRILGTEIRIALAQNIDSLHFRSYRQGDYVPVYASTLALAFGTFPEQFRISFQVVDETALYPDYSSLQQQGLGMLTTPPFATYAEGVIRLEDNYTSQDFRTHCSGTSQTMPVQPITSAISTDSEKTPLLLIHGWTGLGQILSALSQNPLSIDDIIERSRYAPAFCYWQDFILNFNDDPDVSQSLSLAMLRDSYELYSFAYDSQQPIARNVEKLREALSQFDQPVVILAHSMGGIVANTYVQSYEKNQTNKIRHIITAGAPYMGSTIMLCQEGGVDQEIDINRCNLAAIDSRMVEVFLIPILSQPNLAASAAAIKVLAERGFEKIARYKGSQDLSWQFGGISLFPEGVYSVANPYLTSINSNNTPSRNTTFYGDATEGDAPVAEGALAAALKLVSGYPNDSVVPIDSACLTAQPNNVSVGCSGSNLTDLLYREGFSHGEIHTNRNLSAMTVELLRLSGRLLDIDDGTPDGNQRVYIGNDDSQQGCADTGGGFGGDGVCDTALTETKLLIHADFDFGGRFELSEGRLRRPGEDADHNGRIGDGELTGRVYHPRVTMADFRRWRDVYLEYNTSITLSGGEFHPKKNPNGEVVYPNPNRRCFSHQFPYDCPFPTLGDLNGDGIVDLASRMPVAGINVQAGMQTDDNGTPHLTDLEVFYYLTRQNNWWADEMPLPSLSQLTELVMSGDVEIWPRSCLSLPNAVRVYSEVAGELREHTTANDRLTGSTIHTLREGTYMITVTTELADGDRIVLEREVEVKPGSDAFWDPACADIRPSVDGTELSEATSGVTVGTAGPGTPSCPLYSGMLSVVVEGFELEQVTISGVVAGTFPVAGDRFIRSFELNDLPAALYTVAVETRLADGEMVTEERQFEIEAADGCGDPLPPNPFEPVYIRGFSPRLQPRTVKYTQDWGCWFCGSTSSQRRRNGLIGGKGLVPILFGKTFGDPHIVTLDGVAYSTMDLGEFVYARSLLPEGLELQMRQTRLPNFADWASFNTAAALRAGGHVFELRLPESRRAGDSLVLLIDGEEVTFPVGHYTLGDVQFAIGAGNELTVWYPEPGVPDGVYESNMTRIRIGTMTENRLARPDPTTDVLSLDVNMSTPPIGRYRGFLGTPDGDSDNEFVLPDGRQPQTWQDFIEGWRVISRQNSLFTYAPGEGPETYNLPQTAVMPTMNDLLGGAGENFMQRATDLLAGVCQADMNAVDITFVRSIALELAAGRPQNHLLASGLCEDEHVAGAGQPPVMLSGLELSGQITLAGHQHIPISGAAVTIYSSTLGQTVCETISVYEGRYSCGMTFVAPATGSLELSYRISGRGDTVQFERTLRMPAAGSALSHQEDVAVAVERVLRLNGQVRDTSGAAVPSARLRFSGPAYTQAAADAHGYFTTYLPLPDGVSTASLITEATSAGSSGYGQHTQNLSLSETGIIAISYDLVIEPRTNPPGNDLRTERTVIFTGQVQNALVAGMGLGQVSVRISAPGAISRDVCQTTTRSGGEDSGTFECQATLLTDEPFSATITTSNFGSTTTIIDVTADDLPLPGTSTRLDVGTLLNSPRTLQLSGQMTADGVFTANLTMSALSHGYQFGTTQTVTSADGSYSAVMALPDAAPASLDLRYWATVVTPRGVVEVGHTREVTMDGVSGLYSVAQDLTIATRLTLNGRVIVETATHAPVSEGLRVVVSTPDIGQLCQTTTSAQGSFTCTTANDIPVPRSGELELQFTVSQGTTQLTVPISQTFTVSAGSGIIVRLNPEVRIKTTIIELSGTVVNNLGEGVSGVKVAVQGTLTKESTTAQDGSYSIFGMVAEDVTDATLNLTATPPAPDHNLAESTSFTLSLTPQALNQYVQIIELTKRNIQLSGVVSNRFLPGEPVGQTRVRFYEGDRLVCNRTTSSSGRFDCSGFVPSAHTLEILELTYYIDGPAYDQGIIVLSEEQLPTTGRSGTALLDLSAAQSTLRLSGIVTDISGTPIQGATVEITLGNTIHLMTTDIQGGYSHIVAGTGRWWPAIAITYEGSIVSRSLDIIGEPYMLTEHTENFILGSDAPGTSRWVIETGHNRVEGLALGHDERIYLIAATNSIREVMALDDNGSVLWRYPVTTERWDNTLVIGHEGTIFFAEAQGLWNTNKSGNLRALNPDGTLKWSVEFNALPSLPAIAADGTVVIGLSNSQIAALNPETGAVLWTYQATHGDMSQNRVVIGANGTVLAIAQVDWSNRDLIALDANGQLMWQLDQVRQVVAFGDNDVTYVGRRSDDCWCEDFIALDSNGAVLWSYNIWESISTVTVAANGTLFVHSGYEGRAYTAINPDGTLLAELYSLEGSNYYADTSSAAIGTDGIIYEPEGRAIYAFTADDTLLWEFGIVGWQATTPVITTNGRLIVGDSTGRVYAINTTASGLAGSPWPRAGGNNQNTGRAR